MKTEIPAPAVKSQNILVLLVTHAISEQLPQKPKQIVQSSSNMIPPNQ